VQDIREALAAARDANFRADELQEALAKQEATSERKAAQLESARVAAQAAEEELALIQANTGEGGEGRLLAQLAGKNTRTQSHEHEKDAGSAPRRSFLVNVLIPKSRRIHSGMSVEKDVPSGRQTRPSPHRVE
jgi:hypothetical protein